MMLNGGNEHITIKYTISTNTDELKKSLNQLMMDMILIYHNASLDYTRAKLSRHLFCICMYAYMHVSEILLELMLFKYALRSCGLKFMPSLGSYTLLSVE